MKFYTCPECEANFSSKDLVDGKLPLHKFRGVRCPGSGQPVRQNPGERQPARMTAGEINRELDKLEKESSALNAQLIDLGYGNHRYNDIAKLDHPVAKRYVTVTQREWALRQEIAIRFGPGHPSRLPTHRRGWYGPREK